MRDLERHLNRFTTERDYAKRDYDVAKMTETISQGQRLIEALSAELGQ